MSEVLSQSEIDELLRALTSGGTVEVEPTKKERNIRNYDFARPSKFSKDQLRTLDIIFDNYARLVSTYLTGYLRTTAQVESVNAEQVTYSEFSNALSNPVVFSLIDFFPLKGTVVMEMSANIGYAIIDRVLGGLGSGLQKMRDFSEIERILIERVVIQLLSFLEEPWDTVLELKPKLEKIETNSQFAQVLSPNEMIALLTLSIKIGDIEGFMHFCLPHMTLKPIMNKLNTRYWFGSSGEQEGIDTYKDHIEKKLETTKIPVRTILGKTNITVNDFVDLQIGDIVPLDSFVNSDLDVMVGDLLRFRAKPGLSKGKNSIQITSVMRKEE